MTCITISSRCNGSPLLQTSSAEPSFPSLKSLNAVTAIRENKADPGSFLLLAGHAVVEVSRDKTSMTVLAGSIQDTGYKDGNLTVARFAKMLSFTQLENRNHLLVADKGNKRIRRVDLLNQVVDTFGKESDSINLDGETLFEHDTYLDLYDISSQPRTGIIVFTDGGRLCIICNTESGSAETVYNSGSLIKLRRIAFGNTKTYITSQSDGLCIFNSRFELEKCFIPKHDQEETKSNAFMTPFIFGTQMQRTVLPSDIYGIETLSGSTVLVTMAVYEASETGLFTVNINSENATNLCFHDSTPNGDMTGGWNINFMTCDYRNGGSFLLISDSTLHIVGDISGRGTNVEQFELNG